MASPSSASTPMCARSWSAPSLSLPSPSRASAAGTDREERAMSRELIVILTTLGLYAAVVISPGPNFALVSRLAISGSSRAAAGSAIGFGLAAGFYQVLTMAGLSLLLAKVG